MATRRKIEARTPNTMRSVLEEESSLDEQEPTTIAAIKADAMKEWLRVFAALASALAGATLIIAGFIDGHGYRGGFYPNGGNVTSIVIGVILIAGGVSYLWIRSKLHNS